MHPKYLSQLDLTDFMWRLAWEGFRFVLNVYVADGTAEHCRTAMRNSGIGTVRRSSGHLKITRQTDIAKFLWRTGNRTEEQFEALEAWWLLLTKSRADKLSAGYQKARLVAAKAVGAAFGVTVE